MSDPTKNDGKPAQAPAAKAPPAAATPKAPAKPAASPAPKAPEKPAAGPAAKARAADDEAGLSPARPEGYKTQGKVQVIAERNGVRVLSDDVRVWKERTA